MPIRYKLLLVMLSLTVLALLATGGIYFANSQKSLRQAIFHHLETTAGLQVQRTRHLVAQNEERLALITSRTQLRLSLRQYNRTGDRAALEKVTRIIGDARSAIADFEAIHVLDLAGHVLASTEPESVGLALADLPYFASGRERDTANTIVSEDGTERLYASGPLRLDGEVQGVLVVRASIAPLVTMTREIHGLGASGESILTRRTAGGPIAISPLRHADASRNPVPRIDPFGPSVGALQEELDYRGVVVLATAAPVPGTDWGLIVKTDRAEAMAPVRQLRQILLICLVLAIAVAAIAALMLARLLTKPITDLTEAALMIANGDLNRRIRTMTQDELGQLARAFNEMADKLIDANQTLERRVREKTQALSLANRQLVAANAQLENQSRTDELTQIANRRAFDDTLDEEWQRCRRKQQPLSVVMIDIDHFKRFNDVAGHLSGDACLQRVAALLAGEVRRAGELLARYGGEEFSLVLPGVPSDEASRLAERLRRAVETAAIDHPDPDLGPHVTLSLGVASRVPTADEQPERLIEQADQALYRAKHAGRNRVMAA